jgi:4-hydroxybenzoate polyprenyltransferase
MLNNYIQLMRPQQWLKNLMLFFPPFLGGRLVGLNDVAHGLWPVAVFCLASSSTYVFNDMLDAGRDALHPKKRHRPLACERISRRAALVLLGLLVLLAIYGARQVSAKFLALVVGYTLVSCLYSVKLKEVAVVDLFCIAAGFLFRLEAGGEAFKVVISDWLFLSVFLLSLFLSAGKRFGEMVALGNSAAEHRKSLDFYSKAYLQGAMFMTGAVVLVTYTMYVIAQKSLVATVPLCAFGLLRYVLRIESGKSGDPTESLLRDGPLFAVSLLWALMVGWGIYGAG